MSEEALLVQLQAKREQHEIDESDCSNWHTSLLR